MDVQPSGVPNAILVVLTGDMKIDDDTNGIKFSHTFHLIPVDSACKNYWVHNEIFRLNYG